MLSSEADSQAWTASPSRGSTCREYSQTPRNQLLLHPGSLAQSFLPSKLSSILCLTRPSGLTAGGTGLTGCSRHWMWALPELLVVVTPTPHRPLSKGHQTGIYRRGKTNSAQLAAIPVGKKQLADPGLPGGPGRTWLP